MRKLYFSGFILLLLCQAGKGFAQLSPYEKPYRAPDALSPLFLLVNGPDGIFYGSNDFGLDQTWDTAALHFRGNILSYLYYPGIARSGNTSFAVQKAEVYNRWTGREATPEVFINRLEGAQRALKKNKGWKQTRYYFDTSGWLRAIVETSMNPQYQGFYEKCDSLNYTFLKNGSAVINWLQKEHSSGSGYAGTIDCGTLTSDFHQIYKRSDNRITLDKWHNIISFETVSREKWDTCDNGGPKYRRKEIHYDATGRVTLIVNSDNAYASRVSEIAYQYYRLPFSRFLDSVKNMPEYASLKRQVISKWLRSQGPLTYLGVLKTSRYYLRYDSKAGSNIIYPDSPSVRQDTARYVINKSKQRVLAWDNTGESWLKKDAFALYSYGTDTQKHFSVKEIQFLSYKLPGKDTFELAAANFEFTDTIRVGKYQIISFKTGEKGPYRPPEHSVHRGGDVVRVIDDDGAPPLYFSPRPGPTPFGKEKKMVWTENNIVRYLWTKDDVYQLTYYENEP